MIRHGYLTPSKPVNRALDFDGQVIGQLSDIDRYLYSNRRMQVHDKVVTAERAKTPSHSRAIIDGFCIVYRPSGMVFVTGRAKGRA